ncbi:MAG TPA: DNA-3-methyladenine glycosylase [Rhodothermales bacterium]
MQPLPPAFFARETTEVAADLIGKLLVHEHPVGRLVGRVVETEAYTQDEPACHAWNVVHPETGEFRDDRRGASLFGPPGRAYIYLNYGMYWLLNVVTESEGFGAAVLIRAIEPLEGEEVMRSFRPGVRRRFDLTNGPGKLVLAMGISPQAHERMLTEPPLYFAERDDLPPTVAVSTRIGITRGASLPWRFYEEGNPFVSPARPAVATQAG